MCGCKTIRDGGIGPTGMEDNNKRGKDAQTAALLAVTTHTRRD